MTLRDDRGCDYCGLPLPRPLWGPSTVTAVGPAYCCSGCRFAAAVTSERGEEGEARWTLTRLGIAIFLTMNVMVFTLVLWSYDAYSIDATQAVPGALADLLRATCLLFSVPVLLLLGLPLLKATLSDTRQGLVSTDILVLSGVIAAYVSSCVSVLRGSGPLYFEVGCMVLVMITLGRWLEAIGKLRATSTLDELQRLLPDAVCVERHGRAETIPLDQVLVGDVLLIRPSERIPTDGVLLDGRTTLDAQLLTGESWPVVKHAGELISGGSLNLDAPIRLQVTALPSAGTLARLIEAVLQARTVKGRYQQLAERVTRWFLPVVLCLAAGTLVGHGLMRGWGAGLMASLAVVLVACPCALGLATPMAVWTGLGVAARRGIILRSGESLERLAGLRAIRFDKTGTLTTGQPRVFSFHTDESSGAATVLQVARSLARGSRHLFSEAICTFVPERPDPSDIGPVHTRPGLGVLGELRIPASRNVSDWNSAPPTCAALGNEQLMDDLGFGLSARLRGLLDQEQARGRPIAIVGWEGRSRGLFAFEESLRPESRAALQACSLLGLDVGVLTGDHAARGQQIADQLGVPVESQLLPDEKLSRIVAVRTTTGPVAMVGDGINDAAALAAADVGIALGCGTDVARDAADVCLVDDDLDQVSWVIDHARRTVRTIRQNLAWAFGYNSVGIVLAASGWLHPAVAALLMLVSSVVVIANCLRLGAAEAVCSGGDGDLTDQVALTVERPRTDPARAAEAVCSGGDGDLIDQVALTVEGSRTDPARGVMAAPENEFAGRDLTTAMAGDET